MFVNLRAGKDGIALAATTFGLERAHMGRRILDACISHDNGKNVRRKIALRALNEAIQQLTIARDLTEQEIT